MKTHLKTATNALWGGLLTALIASPSWALESTDSRVFYTGPEESGAHRIFGPRLKRAVKDEFDLALTPVSGSREVLEAVLADPATSGFVRLDVYVDFLKSNPDARSTLEIYGDVPVCLFAVRRKSLGAIAEQSPTMSVDLGPVGADTALMFQAIWPEFSQRDTLTVSRKGGYRSLASVSQGRLDYAFVTEFPRFDAPMLKYVQERDTLELAPAIDQDFGPVNLSPAMGYLPTRVSLTEPGLFSQDQVVTTICSPLGVVVNGTASEDDLRFIDTLVRNVSLGSLMKSSNSENTILSYLASAVEAIKSAGRKLTDYISN